jgi:hypothetical protein
VTYVRQRSTKEEDFVAFLEMKKLRVPRDDDLRLVIHLEQEGTFNHLFLSDYLNNRSPKCPCIQVFVFGKSAEFPRKWLCVLVYPGLIVLPELNEDTAKKLILDRKQYFRPHISAAPSSPSTPSRP